MKSDELISIIVPAYNCVNTLGRCLNSILKQTYDNIEVIAVNDGSTDQTSEILTFFSRKHSNIKVYTKTNAGVSSARNDGLRLSKGKYVMFVDSDDLVESTMCEKLVDNMQKSKSDFVVCGYKQVEVNKQRCILPASSDDIPVSYGAQFMTLLNSAVIYTPWGKLYKREYVKNMFNIDKQVGEDLEFNLSYFDNCKRLSWVNESLYIYDKTVEGSLSKKLDYTVYSLADTCRLIEEHMNRKNISTADFSKRYYEKFRLCLQRAYEQKYSYHEFCSLFVRLCTDGGFSTVADKKMTTGFLNNLTRIGIKTKQAIIVYLIIFMKKQLRG